MLRTMSDPQCKTNREAEINFKSKGIWWDNQRGGTIREGDTIGENTVCGLFVKTDGYQN